MSNLLVAFTVAARRRHATEKLRASAGDALTRRAAGLADRVQVIRATGARSDLAAVLVRPDGFVAWAAAPGTIDPTGLDLALATWFVAAT